MAAAIEDIRNLIMEEAEKAIEEAIKEKRYSVVLGCFREEIESMCERGIPLKNQVKIITDSLNKSGYESFEIGYRTYQQFVNRNNLSSKEKTTISPPPKKSESPAKTTSPTVRKSAEIKETKPPKKRSAKDTVSKIDSMRGSLGDILN
jgi:hypothetical protein